MKELTRVIFVNWYLFQAKEWEIRGHTALLGPNGAGKSSFLDAIQYVMLGGNKSYWKPNAKAPDKKSKRDIKGYVLGKIKSGESNNENSLYRQREDALCRLVLVFTDKDTGQETSVGAAISASEHESSEKVEAFFVLDDYGLKLGDLLNTVPGGSVPKTYPELIAHFKQITRGQGCYLFNQSTKYLDQMLRSLCHAEFPASQRKFVRSFKNSISLSNLNGSVSDFVKTSILHSEPLDVATMRDSYASYKMKKAEVVKTKKQIEELTKIKATYKNALSAAELSAAYKWCIAELKFDRLNSEIELAEDKMTHSLNEFKAAVTSLKETGSQLERERENLFEISALIEKDESESTKKLLVERKKTAESKLLDLAKSINQIRRGLGIATELVRYQSLLSEEVITVIDELAAASSGEANDWPDNPKEIDALVQSSLTLIDKESNAIKQRHEGLVIASSENKKIADSLYEQLEAAASGKARISKNAEGLMNLLREQNIDATPICQLIEVTDKSWQAPIEAYLKKQTEALMVPVHQAIEAVNHYKQLKHEFYGVQVINTLKVKDWDDIIRPGTAASLIVGNGIVESDLAVKYIQRLLKDVELVETTEDLMHKGRAITKDGMEQGGGSAQKNRLLSVPKLGALTDDQKQALANEYEQHNKKAIAAREEVDRCDKVKEKLSRLHSSLQTQDSLVNLVKAVIIEQASIDSINSQIEAIDTSKTDELRKQADKLKETVLQLDKSRSRLLGKKAEHKTQFKNSKETKINNETRISKADKDRTEAADEHYFNQERSSQVYEELTEKYELDSPESFESASDKADDNRKYNYTRFVNTQSDGDDYVSKYNQMYGAEGIDTGFMENATVDKKLASVSEALHNLEHLGLHHREEETQKALHEVRSVIRNDVSLSLKGAINQMIRRFKELNRELERRPFTSGITYQFKYEQKSEFRDFLNFVSRVDEMTASDFDSLFDNDQEAQFKIIEDILEEEGDTELLDYRNYYTYDIRLIDKVKGGEELFSEKKGTGSGGEQSTPFYVAMGASLASAYRISNDENEGLKGGLSLYLADEAFHGMDRRNSQQTADYLKSIGLQLFVAAPDELELRFTELVDTKLFFIRDGMNVAVDFDYITPATKDLFKKAYEPSNNDEELVT